MMVLLKLLKQHFPDIIGLESTLFVTAKSCKDLPRGVIQIMHVLLITEYAYNSAKTRQLCANVIANTVQYHHQ